MRKIHIPITELVRLFTKERTPVLVLAKQFSASRDVIQKRLRKAGVILRAKNKEDRIKMFWSRVDKNGPTPKHRPELGPCWVWVGTINGFGYGLMQIGRHYKKQPEKLAHRISNEIAKGPIPSNVKVLHHCDNPPCVRPNHLYRGTQDTNMKDVAKRSRSGRIKFSNRVVRLIRKRARTGESLLALAAEYKVTRQTIWRIVQMKSRMLAKRRNIFLLQLYKKFCGQARRNKTAN